MKQTYKITTFKDKDTKQTIALYTHKEKPELNKAYIDVGTELTRITHANNFSELRTHMYYPSPEEKRILITVEVH